MTLGYIAIALALVLIPSAYWHFSKKEPGGKED